MRSDLKTQGQFRVDTPAKVTLGLEVYGRREDGYHEVEISQAPINWFDSIHASLPGTGPGIGLEVESESDLGAVEENLVHRAAVMIQEALGSGLSVDLRLVKRIPSGAGLGGGSGNAAGLLVALNRWHGAPIGPITLEAMALELGADVPFFLDPRPAVARGIGERLTPLEDFPPLELVVVKPRDSIATAQAYQGVDDLPPGQPGPPGELPEPTPQGWAGALRNRFEEVLFPLYPELEGIKARLLEPGALGAGLSGSGSALYGIFSDSGSRDAAARLLEAEGSSRGWIVKPCQTIPRYRYDHVF